MLVKIFIKRRFKKGKVKEISALLRDFRSGAMTPHDRNQTGDDDRDGHDLRADPFNGTVVDRLHPN